MKHRSDQGFTIVELLIVVVVIAILAAITIVSYNGIRNRANETAVRSDMSSFAKKLELLKADGDKYPATFTSSMGLSLSKGSYASSRNNVYYCVSPAADKYVIGVIASTGAAFYYESDKGLLPAGSVSGANTCERAGRTDGWTSSYMYNQLGHNHDQPGTRGWAAWLQ